MCRKNFLRSQLVPPHKNSPPKYGDKTYELFIRSAFSHVSISAKDIPPNTLSPRYVTNHFFGVIPLDNMRLIFGRTIRENMPTTYYPEHEVKHIPTFSSVIVQSARLDIHFILGGGKGREGEGEACRFFPIFNPHIPPLSLFRIFNPTYPFYPLPKVSCIPALVSCMRNYKL